MAQGGWTDPARAASPSVSTPKPGSNSRADLKPKTRHQYQWLMTSARNADLAHRADAKVTFEDLSRWVSRLSVWWPWTVWYPAVGFRRIRRTRSRGAKRAHSIEPCSGPWPAPAQTPRLRVPHSRPGPRAGRRDGRWRVNPAAALHRLALGRGYRPARLRHRPRPPPHRCTARLLRRRRPCRPGHPEVAPVPDGPDSAVPRRRARSGRRRQARRRARVHHARRQCHAAVQLAARHLRARPQLVPVSATGSGFTTCGTPPRR